MTPRRISSRQSDSFLRRRRHKQILVTVGTVVGVSLFVVCLSWVTRWDSFQVTDVAVYGADAELVTDIKAEAEELLSGAYLGLFSRSHSWIYPEDALVARIPAISPHIDTIATDIQDGNTLVISVTEKTPAAVVCNGLPDFDGEELSQEKECYFVDRGGVAFGSAPSFSGPVYKRYYVSQTLGIGTTTLPDSFEMLQSFYDAIRAADIDAQAILAKEDHEYELYIRTATPDDLLHMTIVYFNTTRDITEQRDNFLAFWSHTEKEDREKGTSSLFDSIDIRYGSNIFYRITTP
ncbi:MAG: hypothetical protein AAB381_03315 [Patescibacteria group bacterium]